MGSGEIRQNFTVPLTSHRLGGRQKTWKTLSLLTGLLLGWDWQSWKSLPRLGLDVQTLLDSCF